MDLGGFEPPNDQPRTPSRAKPVLYSAGALLVALTLGFALWPRGEELPPATTTTTTTTEATTTTVEQLPGGTFEVATVRPDLERISVSAFPPEEWDELPPSVVTDPDFPLPPESQPEMPERVALPTIDAPIAGRYATELGWEFNNPGPFDPPQPMTMLVRERRGDWALVDVPVRPNGTQGYVRLSDVELERTQYRIEVNVGERMLRAFADSEVIAETQVVVGADGTPTPTGTFYVTDIVPQTSPFFGPVALAIDGYSETLDEFDGGVPVVALHGTNRPELMGQNVSNGCIRVPNEIITMLADTLPRGAPVLIWP